MNRGQTVFAQLMSYLSHHDFTRSRRSLQGQLQNPSLLLLEPISCYGFRPTHASRELARYRGLPPGSPHQTLSLRLRVEWSNVRRSPRPTKIAIGESTPTLPTP